MIPEGTGWYSKHFHTLYVNRFSDWTYEREWDKFLQEQRTLARRNLNAKVIETRYKLGLPIQSYYRA